MSSLPTTTLFSLSSLSNHHTLLSQESQINMKFITVAIICLVAGLAHGAALSEQVLGTLT
jgi:hypothetical protein